ncbi:MAG: FliH/SctL family protein, partial [Candidatus Omnitrophica bacterium]|nr:FliH/SctL family protein [Candidatus Omnitrophota bacterium]
VIREEVKHSSKVVQRMAKEAVGLLADRQELVVRLNPADMSKLKEAGADPGMLGAAGAKIEFIADSFVTEGGCMVQSKSSTVDADIKTQLDEIETALLRKKHGSEDQSH